MNDIRINDLISDTLGVLDGELGAFASAGSALQVSMPSRAEA